MRIRHLPQRIIGLHHCFERLLANSFLGKAHHAWTSRFSRAFWSKPRTRLPRLGLRRLNVKIAVLAAAIPWIVPAHAHSWYPVECCAGTHCHETDRVRELPDGSAQVQVGNETIVVPRGLKRRTSPDEHYHLCYGQWDGVAVVYCFFEPAQA